MIYNLCISIGTNLIWLTAYFNPSSVDSHGILRLSKKLIAIAEAPKSTYLRSKHGFWSMCNKRLADQAIPISWTTFTLIYSLFLIDWCFWSSHPCFRFSVALHIYRYFEAHWQLMFNPEQHKFAICPSRSLGTGPAFLFHKGPLCIFPFQRNEVTIHLICTSATLDTSLCCQRLPEILIG